MDLLHSTHIVGNGSRAPAYRRLNLLRIEATVNPGRPTLAPRSAKEHASETRVPNHIKRPGWG